MQKFNVGNVLEATQLTKNKKLVSSIIKPMVDVTTPENIAMGKNITFHQNLLAKDERISKMDLEYWIDYVYLFGVSDMIPLYDKVDPITFRNWDVYVLSAIILFIVFQVVYTICCCRCFCLKAKAPKTKVD